MGFDASTAQPVTDTATPVAPSFDPSTAAPVPDQPWTASGGLQALGAGINRGTADLAGLASDTINNAITVGHAIRGTLTSQSHGKWLDVSTGKEATPAQIAAHHSNLGKRDSIELVPAPVEDRDVVTGEGLPFGSEDIKRRVNSALGDDKTFKAQQDNAANRFIASAGEAGMQGVGFGVGGGSTATVARRLAGSVAATEAGTGAANAAQDAGFGPGASTGANLLASVLAGHAVGRIGAPGMPHLDAETPPTGPVPAFTPDTLAQRGLELAAQDAERAKPKPKITTQAPETAQEPPAPAPTPETLSPAPPAAKEAPKAPVPVKELTPETPLDQRGPQTLISAERGKYTPEENKARTGLLETRLKATGLPYARTRDMYTDQATGQPAGEDSFTVATPSLGARTAVRRIGNDFEQESVLHADEDGARLHNLKNSSNPGGTMSLGSGLHEVSQAEAQAAGNWTEHNGKYYVAGDAPPQVETTPTAAEPKPLGQTAVGNSQRGSIDLRDKPGDKDEKSRVVAPAMVQPSLTQRAVEFAPPTEEGSANAPLSPGQQAARRDALSKLTGLKEARLSAITGDTNETGTDFQTSKLKDTPHGDRIAGVIEGEQSALRQHAQSLVDRSGGTDGNDQIDRANAGRTMATPVENYERHLDAWRRAAYDEAAAKAKGQPFALDEASTMLTKQRASFLATPEGKQLLEGLHARAEELGLKTGANETFNPATVEQAEQLRQFANEAWTPKTAKVIEAFKDALDRDVIRQAGSDLYEKARALQTHKSIVLDEPKGIQALRAPDDRLGINREVPYEDIPKKIATLPPDQLKHIIDTYSRMAALSPEFAKQAHAAVNEIRGYFANEAREIGSPKGQPGQPWRAAAVNKFLRANIENMQQVFSPSELEHYRVLNDAGNALRMDRSYPGAFAQGHNAIVGKALGLAEHGATAAGALLGHIPGTAVGYAAGKAVGALDKASLAKAAEKRVVDLTKGPEEPSPPPTTGGGGALKLGQIRLGSKQRGSFSLRN